MDLRLTTQEPTAAARAAVDAVLGEYLAVGTGPPAVAASPSGTGAAGAGGLAAAARGPLVVTGAATDAEAAAGEALHAAAAGGRIAVAGAHGSLRHLLLPALHGVQDAVGWISAPALGYICRRLDVPPAEVYGVASFYALLATAEQPAQVAHVCDDVVCRNAGALEICRQLERDLGPAHRPPPGAEATWVPSPCLGQCERAPAVLLQLAGATNVTLAPAAAPAVAEALRQPSQQHPRAAQWGGFAPTPAGVPAPDRPDPAPSHTGPPGADPAVGAASVPDAAPAPGGALFPAASHSPRSPHLSAPQTADLDAAARLTLLRRVGAADPASIDDYRRHGGFAALGRALELGPDGVLDELRASKLLGRGGAAFPAATKWEAVARASRCPHYVVCNADESETGTFKDRVLMEQDPFAVIESLAIAGLTTGAEQGYLYIRGEYPLAERRLLHAIAAAREAGLLGANVLGSGLRFELELRRGAGAYICGEETALFNSLEGFRGEPRSKPPYPTEVGLFGQPTAVNNVETLVNLLPIVTGGGRAYAARGTAQSTGPKLFCLSGAVATPGVYEVEFGVTLRELLGLAGGCLGGEPRAVLLGGAAGSFVGPEHLDVPLTFEGTRAIGATLGSGVVMPFSAATDFRDVVQRIARFFRDESCGQCVPCRVGTVRQEEALQRWAQTAGTAVMPATPDTPGEPPRAGTGTAPANGGVDGLNRTLLADLARVMQDASICGLGHTASTALQSALKLGLLEPTTETGRSR